MTYRLWCFFSLTLDSPLPHPYDASVLISYAAMQSSVEAMVLTVLAIFVIVIFLWSVYAFIQSIILFIFSGGDSEKVKKARNGIRYMVLGIVLTLAFLFVFPLVFKRIRLPWYEVYTATNIFRQAGYLTTSLFGFGKEAVVEYQKGADAWTDFDEQDPPPPPTPSGNGTLEL